VAAVRAAGGTPIPIFANDHDNPFSHLPFLQGVLLTGGGDPDTRSFGEPVHPQASLVDPKRQAFEERLLRYLHEEMPDFPTLGVCFGMQMMGLLAHGRLEQHLPDVLTEPQVHVKDHVHRVHGLLGEGMVTSSHHQALKDPGSLHIVSRSEDGVIEGVFAPDRRFYLGVQWHPERTHDQAMGLGLFQ
jgi:putative glutamine amidotransferase